MGFTKKKKYKGVKIMQKYHVGLGLARIYAGRINKKGDTWLEKNDVTQEALNSVAIFLINKDESMLFEYMGKEYILSVKEVEK